MQAKVLFVYLSVCLSAGEISGSINYFCSQSNEVFLKCGCHRTCRDPARTCGGTCQKGCFCRGNELRDEDGNCVDPKYCPSTELPFDEFYTLEPYDKGGPVSPRKLTTSKSRSEDNISTTSELQEEKGAESHTKKSYTLEPFGKLSVISQTKKLYTYNPFYDEFRTRELYTLGPRDGVAVALSNIKNLYTLKLHNAGSSVSHNDKSYTSKPRGKWNVLSFHKVLYSSKSRGEGSAVSHNDELYTSMVRGKAGPASQNKELYVPKSINNGGAVYPNKKLSETKNPEKQGPVSPKKGHPVFPEHLYTPKPQSKKGPVSAKKELYKSKYLKSKGSPLTQNKKLYSSKSRGKTGPVSPSKELKKFKSLGKSPPHSQNIELYTSKSRDNGDVLSPKELNTSKFRGKAGHVFPKKQLYHTKTLGKGGPLSQNKELYTSKFRGKGDPAIPKELYTSKSRGKAGPVSQNKKLYNWKSRGKGVQVSTHTELHASKSSGNGSILSYYKELKTFKSLGNGSTANKVHSSNFRKTNKTSNITKSLSKGRPSHNKDISHVKLQCPPNEEFRRCEHCNRTCEDPKPVCTAACSMGCFCKKTLLRDVDGSCVKLRRCSNIWKRMKRMEKHRKRFSVAHL